MAVRWIDFREPSAPDRELLEHAQQSAGSPNSDLDFDTLLVVGGLATPNVIHFRT